jgi:hypothetical protein
MGQRGFVTDKRYVKRLNRVAYKALAKETLKAATDKDQTMPPSPLKGQFVHKDMKGHITAMRDKNTRLQQDIQSQGGNRKYLRTKPLKAVGGNYQRPVKRQKRTARSLTARAK